MTIEEIIEFEKTEMNSSYFEHKSTYQTTRFNMAKLLDAAERSLEQAMLLTRLQKRLDDICALDTQVEIRKLTDENQSLKSENEKLAGALDEC